MSSTVTDSAFQPSTSADEAWLRQFLDAARARAPATLGLEEVYGFLFAVVAAPDLVSPSEWIAAIFDAEEPTFDEDGDRVRFHRSIMALHDQLKRDARDGTVSLPKCIALRDPAEQNFAKDAPLMLWASGFAQGHDWLEEAWDVDLPKDLDDELGACLGVLLFFIDPAFAGALLEETGRPASELPTMARTMLEGFESAMLGYVEIGRIVYEARSAD
jgi:yecA family protein